VIRNTRLINESDKKNRPIKVLYNDIVIDNITISNVIFWNGGNDTIVTTDLPNNTQLAFSIADYEEILDFTLLEQSVYANGVNLIKSGNSKLIIDFDYFDSKEAFVVQIIHTEKIFKNISFYGIFKGSPSIKETKPTSEKNIAALAFLFPLSLLLFLDYSQRKSTNFTTLSIAIYTIIILLMVFLLFFGYKQLMALITESMPKKLSKFIKP
jgi:hypothetical protein